MEAAAERIRAFVRSEGRGGGYRFEGPTALEVLEEATGGFTSDTVRLAREALARAGGAAVEAEPPTPRHPTSDGVPQYGADPGGRYRQL